MTERACQARRAVDARQRSQLGPSWLLASVALLGCGGDAPTGANAPAAESAALSAPALQSEGPGEVDLSGALAIELTPALRAILERVSPLPPPPPDPTNRVADDPDAARYGQALFFDPRFSRDGTVACATCHDPAHGFTDGRSVAQAFGVGTRHTPTLWNVALQRWLTWDGRADSLWMQAFDPLEDTREMDATRAAVAQHIARDPALRGAHEALFGPLPAALSRSDLPARARPARAGDPADLPEVVAWRALDEEARAAIDRVCVEVTKAIAAYQRLLVRGDAPFDDFARGVLTGDPELVRALEPAGQRGFALFFGRANCAFCHSGPNFSDGEFHNNSLPTLDGGTPRDSGRYGGAAAVKASPLNADGPHSDERGGERALAVRLLRTSSETWGEFRTPSLRNLAHREPFMHQGQFPDLDAVLDFYSTLEGQSGRNHHQERILVPLHLTPEERADLRAFLGALEGAPAPPGLLAAPAGR
ncbi:MAG: cytochrome c peroxidase [Planctomycetota bacterium]